MLETNLRIVYPGTNLYVWVKRARLIGTDLTPEIIQRACGSLRHRYGIAAIPEPGEAGSLLVATKNEVQGIRLTEADWSVEIQDMDEPAVQIELGCSSGQRVIPLILERALEAQIARTTNLWSMDSPSIWYEPEPIATRDGIAIYRRYEIASLFIEGVGVGIAVDVGIAFFSAQNLSYYLDESVSPEDQSARQSQLIRLTDRQERHKGTLLYDNHNVKMKCYLEQFSPGITCDTTGEIRVKDISYPSLTAYYRATLPGLVFDPNSRAVRVSFAHRGSSVWISAQLAKIRVANKQLPRELRNADKISPQERRELTIQFWQNLGTRPFGSVAPAPINGFWRPDEARIIQLPLPDLIFGQDYTLKAPSQLTPRSYRAYYQERDKLLDDRGCYSSHPQMPRTLYFAYPVGLAQDAVRKLAVDLTSLVAKWTGRPINFADPISYDSVAQANTKLLESNAEAVIFILGKDPRAYHDAAYKNPWRIKRITERSIKKHYESTIHPLADKSRQNGNQSSAQRQWNGFVRMNALAVLRLLEGVPFRIQASCPFEAQLGIDVGYDRRHFAISLQIARRDDLRPNFRTWTDFQIKPDQQHEAINPIMLNDQIVNTFQRAMGRRFDPIQSLIVFRDGQLFASEIEGISSALEILKQQGIFSPDVRVELADFRKNSKKSIRIWEYRNPADVENPLEGVVVLLNGKSAVVTTTGAATLTQGTSQPYLIYAKSEQADLQNIALAAFHGAQLNWSSLRVAQRLPLVLKTADDELKARDAQEIRLLK